MMIEKADHDGQVWKLAVNEIAKDGSCNWSLWTMFVLSRFV